jgi:hypothetical protein
MMAFFSRFKRAISVLSSSLFMLVVIIILLTPRALLRFTLG